MGITKEQKQAYREVIEVLKYMPKEEVAKIPNEKLKFYSENADMSYNFNIDKNKSFEEQVLLEKTKVVLAILFRDYWATDIQREKIKQKEKYDMQKLEQEKQEKYDVDNIFKQRQEKQVEEVQALVEYKKETWYSKFINFMKRVFKSK